MDAQMEQNLADYIRRLNLSRAFAERAERLDREADTHLGGGGDNEWNRLRRLGHEARQRGLDLREYAEQVLRTETLGMLVTRAEPGSRQERNLHRAYDASVQDVGYSPKYDDGRPAKHAESARIDALNRQVATPVASAGMRDAYESWVTSTFNSYEHDRSPYSFVPQTPLQQAEAGYWSAQGNASYAEMHHSAERDVFLHRLAAREPDPAAQEAARAAYEPKWAERGRQVLTDKYRAVEMSYRNWTRQAAAPTRAPSRPLGRVARMGARARGAYAEVADAVTGWMYAFRGGPRERHSQGQRAAQEAQQRYAQADAQQQARVPAGRAPGEDLDLANPTVRLARATLAAQALIAVADEAPESVAGQEALAEANLLLDYVAVDGQRAILQASERMAGTLLQDQARNARMSAQEAALTGRVLAENYSVARGGLNALTREEHAKAETILERFPTDGMRISATTTDAWLDAAKQDAQGRLSQASYGKAGVAAKGSTDRLKAELARDLGRADFDRYVEAARPAQAPVVIDAEVVDVSAESPPPPGGTQAARTAAGPGRDAVPSHVVRPAPTARTPGQGSEGVVLDGKAQGLAGVVLAREADPATAARQSPNTGGRGQTTDTGPARGAGAQRDGASRMAGVG